MDVLFLLARILFGLVFLAFAMNHFTQVAGMAAYAGSKGVPAPRLSVLGSGLLLVIGALSIGTGILPWLGVLSLVAFLLPAAFIMHNFWTVEDPQFKAVEMAQFMKNVSLSAAALMLLAIPAPWALSLGGLLF